MIVVGQEVQFTFIVRKSALGDSDPPLSGKFDLLTEGPNDNGAHFLDGVGLQEPVSVIPSETEDGSFTFKHTFADDGLHEGLHRFTLVYRNVGTAPDNIDDDRYIVLGSMLVNVIGITTEQDTTVDYII